MAGTDELGSGLRARLVGLGEPDPVRVPALVDVVLEEARRANASDVHFQPTEGGLSVLWRFDGVLHEVLGLPARIAPNVVARLKVLADLLTYRTDAPQEGRIRRAPDAPEMRLSTFPTLHGERAVVRLFAEAGGYERLDDLGFPAVVRETIGHALGETSGLLVLAGPAGSGKTTTLYACLREFVADALTVGRRCLMTLEDPIEVAVAGVVQSQIHPQGGFTLESGLRSILRQDPEVIGVGEMRDRATAEVALQAALTGHLVLTTFHAGSAAGALARLSEMGLEPYLVTSGVIGVVFQRLARRLCDCSRPADSPDDLLGLDVGSARLPVGCDRCRGTGYRGRIALTETLSPARGGVRRALLDGLDVDALERAALADGMVSRWSRAIEAIEAGETSPAEVRRVLGLGKATEAEAPPVSSAPPPIEGTSDRSLTT